MGEHINFIRTDTHTHTHDKYIYNMYIKLDPRSSIDNCCVIEPPPTSSLLRWRRGISRKKGGERNHAHLKRAQSHNRHTTVGIGRGIEQILKKKRKEMRKMIEIIGGNYL